MTVLDTKADRFWLIKSVERRTTQEGLDDVTAGGLIPVSEARAWADNMGTEHEKAIPVCSPGILRRALREQPHEHKSNSRF
jgi:hypothetical protein